jgi:predicted dehydrogenase/flavin reductase (DIM6/NTAB) family NADH-FMN oxidoreductase RutF
MRLPAKTIWDTRIQAVCSVVAAREGDGVELWLCGNFGQVSLEPPRIIVNPNRLYPIEGAIRKERRFSLNVLPATARDAAIRLIRARRREPDKAAAMGLATPVDTRHDMPRLEGAMQTLFCEVEEILDTGDHTVMIARVLEARTDPALAGQLPLLYREIGGVPSKHPGLARAVRTTLTVTGAMDVLQRVLRRRRAQTVDLPGATYWDGGQTEAEISEILQHGVRDLSRAIVPPQQAPAVLRRKVGLCVVGIGQWGSYHSILSSRADPNVELYVCGRNAERTAHTAKAVGAKGMIVGLERAVEDPRVEALSLVLPHHLHADATCMAVAAGKHVMVEKPIATKLAEADRMIEAARRAGRILMVAENMHFRAAVRDACRAISAGDIGEPLYFTAQAGGVMRPEGWKADRDLMGGGVMMDVGVHYVRALRLLMGEPERVLVSRAMQIHTKMAGEDSAEMLFESVYGWRARMLLNWAGPRGFSPDIIVSGDQGTIHLWPAQPYYDLYPAAPLPLPSLLSYVRPLWLADKLMRPTMQRLRRRIPDSDNEGYLTEIREYLAAVAEGREPRSTAEDGRRDVEIVLRSYAALESGTWERIPEYAGRTTAV